MAHAKRKTFGALAANLTKLNQFEQWLNAVVRDSGGGANDSHVLVCSQAAVESARVEHRANLRQWVRQLAIGLATNQCLAAGWGCEPKQAAQSGALAGAVWAKKAGDATGLGRGI